MAGDGARNTLLQWVAMKTILAVTMALACSSACYGAVASFTLSGDGTMLSVQRSDRTQFVAPRTDLRQVALGNVKLSANGRYIGWSVGFPNCCTSYPIPRALVIHDGLRIVRIIHAETLSIFDWRFSSDGSDVLYREELLHGISTYLYRWIRIQGGKVMGKFDCFPYERGGLANNRVRPPKWAQASTVECAN